METILRKPVVLALADSGDENLWEAILESQGVGALASAGRLDMAERNLASRPCSALVVDMQVLTAGPRPAEEAVRALIAANPALPVLARLPARVGVGHAERAWAQSCGIASLLPGSTAAAWRDSIAPIAARLLAVAGFDDLDMRALERVMNEMVRRGAEPRPGAAKDIFADAFALEGDGVDALALLRAMQQPGGVKVADRAYLGKSYPACFVAAEALDWLERHARLRRATAERACRFLWRTGRIHHVLREASFADDFLFFRFGGTREQLAALDLRRLAATMRGPGGVEIADRTWRGMGFPRCFVGADAVEWIMDRERLPFGAAESVGQSMLELGILRHVSGEHGFVGARLFYRFAIDEKSVVPKRVPA